MSFRILLFAGMAMVWAAFSVRAQTPAKVTYTDHVLPILRDKCGSCHNQDKARGSLVVENYGRLIEGGSSGAVIKPGDPDGSKLIQTITHKTEPFMPPKSPMIPAESIATIRKWIEGGALETAGSKTPPIAGPKTNIGLASIVKGKPAGPPPMPPAKLSVEPVVRSTKANAITAIASNPWSPLVAVASQKQVLLYHADTLDLLGVLPFPEGIPYVLKFSRNGSLLLAGGGIGGKSGRVVVWNVTTGERVIEVGQEHDAVLAADISPDQTMIALGGPSKVIRIFSTKDVHLEHEVKKHTDWVYSLEYSPDGVLLATGDRNGGLFVWEAHTAREYFSLRGHTAAIMDVSWRQDSNVLASASEDTTVRLWEMENGGQIKSWGAHGGGVQAVKYAMDGRLVTCGRDRVVKTWDGNGAQQKAFDAFNDLALRATFSHDGTRVIAGDWTGEIRCWTAADAKLAGTLQANPPTVAERLDGATKDVAAKEAANTQALAVATASQAAATKAAADLAAAQKAVTDSATTVKTATDAVAKAKAASDQANAAVVTAQAVVTAKDIAAKVYAEAAAKIKAEADKVKTNAELNAQAVKAATVATTAAAEMAAAQKIAADVGTAAKTAATQFTAAQQMMTTVSAAAAAAPKNVDAQMANVKATAAKAAADKAAADQASAALATAKARLERLKTSVATASAKAAGK